MTFSAGFSHTSLPMRVVFGSGRINDLPIELDRLGLEHVMVICTPTQLVAGRTVADLLGSRAHSAYPYAEMHVPVAVAAAAIDYARTHCIDGCVTVGGGSSIGLGKAIALETGLPTVALPTTYAGSEMTPIWGLPTTTARPPAGIQEFCPAPSSTILT
jgi:maleylacetate reductase